MWFSDSVIQLSPNDRIIVLGLTAIALVAALQIWVVQGRAPFWARWGSLLAVVAALAYFEAFEPILFLEAHLLTILLLTGAAPLRRPPGGGATRRFEGIGLAIILCVETIIATAFPLAFTWLWLLSGALAGALAIAVDLVVAPRQWILWSAIAGLSMLVAAAHCAVLASFTTASSLVANLEELLQLYFPSADNFNWYYQLAMFGYGTLLYWAWRILTRIAWIDSRPVSIPLARRPCWSRFTANSRRALRLAIVYPLWFAVGLLILTPTLELAWGLSRLRVMPLPSVERNDYELLTFADDLDWSACPHRGAEDISDEASIRFVQANATKMARLETILQASIRPTIDYARLSPPLPPDDEARIEALAASIYMIHEQALRQLDPNGQMRAIRWMLRLSQVYQRDCLTAHLVMGLWIEEIGLGMAYRSRWYLTDPQCDALIELVSSAEAAQDQLGLIAKRTEEWALHADGWRARAKKVTIAQDTLRDHFQRWSLHENGRMRDALRAALICEVALRRFAVDREMRFPDALEELVPQYLKQLPRDPYRDDTLVYRRAGGPIPYTLFSVGNNGTPDTIDLPTFDLDDVYMADHE